MLIVSFYTAARGASVNSVYRLLMTLAGDDEEACLV